jgi:hypothetical protein
MTISSHQEQYWNKPVKSYEPGQTGIDVARFAYRLQVEYDDKNAFVDVLQGFIDAVDTTQLDALIIGAWNDPNSPGSQDILDCLVRSAPKLQALKALFVGDITYEESEISWIVQGRYDTLLNALPGLQELRIRGATELAFPPVQHAQLRRLIIESGGLPMAVIDGVAASRFPALEHLELWLGSDNYGFDGSVDALAKGLLAKGVAGISPVLKSLALRDSEISDPLAVWLAQQTWVASLDSLDLSLGVLGDVGAKALVASPYVAQLKKLDLTHHYISEPVMKQLQALPLVVVLDEAEGAGEEDRYISVSE